MTSTESSMPAPLQMVMQRLPRLERLIRFVWRLSERWSFDRCSISAAAMAFFVLLSLFPLLLAAITIIGKVLAGNQRALRGFLDFVASYFPARSGAFYQDRVQEAVNTIDVSSNLTIVGIFSVLWLLWSGRAFFDTLAFVLNSIWPDARPRTWLQHQAVLWSTVFGAGLLWLLSTSVTFVLSAVQTFSAHWPDLFLMRQPLLWNALGRGSAWLLSLLMFWTIYRFLPNAPSGRRGYYALHGALAASLLWEFAKWVFTRFLPDSTRYGAIYGSFAGVVLTMMWLYISSSIILLGAEFAATFAESHAIAHGEARPTRHVAADRELALPHTQNSPPSTCK